MENKKLLRILQKDMNELEELIAEIKMQRNFSELEMEFIHTKAKGVMQLVQLLSNTENNNGNDEILVKNEKIEELKETVSEIQHKVTDDSKEGINTQEEVESKKVEKELSNESDNKDQNVVEKESEDKPENKVKPEKNEVSEPQESGDEKDDDMLEDEEDLAQAGSTLGDSFLKGKSINDILTDQNKLEFKLSNRHVESIKTAIGINDRFQYIRELFDGNSEKFADAVQTLDSKQNIKEAVDYLRQNYKWKKSETSLKFVNLVKRRFQNE